MKIKSRLKAQLQAMLPKWHFTTTERTQNVILEIEIRKARIAGKLKPEGFFNEPQSLEDNTAFRR